MRHSWSRFTVSLFALAFVVGNAARADKIDFSWQSSFTPTSIAPDQPTQGARIYFLSEQGTSPSGLSHDQYAVGVAYQSPPWLSSDAAYTNKLFAMTLKLTDGPSGLSDTLTFHGMVNGTIAFAPPPLAEEGASFSFSDGLQSITIGQDIYHIAMQSGPIWGGTDPIPNIFAQIEVAHVSNNPEPSSLLLAVMALPALGFARWKKSFARTKDSKIVARWHS